MHLKIIRILVLATAAVLIVAAAGTRDAAADGPYRFMVNYEFSMGGESAATVDAMLTGLAEVVKEKIGVEVEMLSAESRAEVYDKLKAGEIDLAILRPAQYLRAVEDGLPIRPMLSLAFNGDVNVDVCLFVRKGSEEESGGLDVLRGKRLMILENREWIYTQNHLKENGIEAKLTDYFSQVLEGNNPKSAMYTLLFKKVDVIALTDMAYLMAVGGDKRFNKISKLECMGKYPVDPLVFHENFNKDAAIALAKTLLKAHRDQDYREFHVYFIAGNANFEKVTPEVYEPFRERMEAAREAGWLDDYGKWKKSLGD